MVLEKTLESPLDCKEIQPVHPKGNQSWNIHWKDWCWSSKTLATWCEELTLWKRPWCWERLKAGEEGDNRGWDGWMASPTQWTWVSVSPRSWWWTREAWCAAVHGVAMSWTQLSNWTELNWIKMHSVNGKNIWNTRVWCQMLILKRHIFNQTFPSNNSYELHAVFKAQWSEVYNAKDTKCFFSFKFSHHHTELIMTDNFRKEMSRTAVPNAPITWHLCSNLN